MNVNELYPATYIKGEHLSEPSYKAIIVVGSGFAKKMIVNVTNSDRRGARH